MKILLCLVLSCIFVSVNAQCRLKTGKDIFTGVETRSSNYETVGTAGKNGRISFKLTEYKDNGNSMRLSVIINRLSIRHLDENSKILLKASGQIITLMFLGQNHGGTQIEDYTELSLENISFLKKNKIDDMRVYYERDFDDFDMTNVPGNDGFYYDNKSDYFIRTLKCFE